MSRLPAYDYNHPLAMQNFDSGYFHDSSYLHTSQRVFPGLQQIGNESGANGPIYIVNAADAPLIAVNRRYIGQNKPVLMYMR